MLPSSQPRTPESHSKFSASSTQKRKQKVSTDDQVAQRILRLMSPSQENKLLFENIEPANLMQSLNLHRKNQASEINSDLCFDFGADEGSQS